MKKFTILDGATGTCLWEKAEKRGFPKDPVWKYNIDHPEIVEELQREYIAAGSEIIQTNTFSVNRPSLLHSPGYDVSEVVRAGVRITKKAVEGTNAKCSLDVGPLPLMLEPYGDMEEDECREIYEEIFSAGMAEHPDLISLETFTDVEMLRIAAEEAKKYGVPVICSMTFEKSGKTMFGNTVEDAVETLTPLGIDGIGLNCSLGPDLALPVIREFSERTKLPLFFKPNAGMPVIHEDGSTTYDYDAETFAKELAPAFEYVSYAGSCCGSSPEYIAEIRRSLEALNE
ncbi:MAG: homocysteine S-methyltransferase family protein [Lachnospiraceae bacterium]|nr:homocysteine S-methyltransferase family protein [Lachnospiraceae bacterium]